MTKYLQAYGQDRLTIAHPVPTEAQSHATSAQPNASHHNEGSSRRVLPYQIIDQRLVSSHQSLRNPSKQDHPYFQSSFVEKIVPSIEGPSQENSQGGSMTIAQRPPQHPFKAHTSHENMPLYQPVLQRVVSHTNDHMNLAKRRRTDDVELHDHGFWQTDQQQRRLDQPTLVPLNERDRKVEYMNYGDIRQQVGETRLIPIKGNMPSDRPSLDSREQGNWERFSSNNQERVMFRPTQHHAVSHNTPHVSSSYVPISPHDSKSLLHVSQNVPLERTSVLQRPERAVEHAQHRLQNADAAQGRPLESDSLTRWEDPRREVIVIDSPESHRSVRAMPTRDDPNWSTRVIPVRDLQTHAPHYETRPGSYLASPEGKEQQHRILLQNGETLHRYNATAESSFQVKQERQPVLLQQGNYVVSPRRDTVQGSGNTRSTVRQQQQPQSPSTARDGRWYDPIFDTLTAIFVLY